MVRLDRLMAENSMSKPPARCIFCGQAGVTKEHLLPNWLRHDFPRSSLSTHTQGFVRWEERQKIVTTKKLQGHSGTKKLRVVCRSCNNGWMSHLEEAIKPTLLRLIRGEEFELSAPIRQMLALWASKTVCVAERLNASQQLTGQGERDIVFRREVPPMWFVYGVPYQGEKFGELYSHQQTVRVELPNPTGHDATSHYLAATKFGLGKFFLLVLSTSWPLVSKHFANYAVPPLVAIWPSTHQTLGWTTDRSIGDREADVVIHMLDAVIADAKPGEL